MIQGALGGSWFMLTMRVMFSWLEMTRGSKFPPLQILY